MERRGKSEASIGVPSLAYQIKGLVDEKTRHIFLYYNHSHSFLVKHVSYSQVELLPQRVSHCRF